MNILVTGCAGFIGSNFVYHMLAAHPDLHITGLDLLTYAGNLMNLDKLTPEQKARFHFSKGDICDGRFVLATLQQHKIQAVVNFAAESHVDRSIVDPQVFLKTNVLGTQTLLDACRSIWHIEGSWQDSARFLQVSTDEVYGSLGPTGLFSETTPLDPHSPYSASKASADLLARAYHDTYGMPVLITRCSNNYGPYQFPEKLIPLMIRNALRHEPLPVYGDGKQVRDWLHVEDHCRAIESVLLRGKPGAIYNIGGNNERKNIDVVKTILEQLQQEVGDASINEGLIRHVKDRLGHDRRYAIDASFIAHELDWRPEISFAQGIRDTICWYLGNQEWMSKVISGEYQAFYDSYYQLG